MLAESPKKATLCTRGFSSLVASPVALIASGWTVTFSRRTKEILAKSQIEKEIHHTGNVPWRRGSRACLTTGQAGSE